MYIIYILQILANYTYSRVYIYINTKMCIYTYKYTYIYVCIYSHLCKLFTYGTYSQIGRIYIYLYVHIYI